VLWCAAYHLGDSAFAATEHRLWNTRSDLEAVSDGNDLSKYADDTLLSSDYPYCQCR